MTVWLVTILLWRLSAGVDGFHDSPVGESSVERNDCRALQRRLTDNDEKTGSLGRFIVTKVTWLILPVVICLSQRLSHASVRTSSRTVKLRMAH